MVEAGASWSGQVASDGPNGLGRAQAEPVRTLARRSVFAAPCGAEPGDLGRRLPGQRGTAAVALEIMLVRLPRNVTPAAALFAAAIFVTACDVYCIELLASSNTVSWLFVSPR
jgi:hypothetical protein